MVVLSNRDQGQVPLTCSALLLLAPDLEVCLQLLYMGLVLQAEGLVLQAEGVEVQAEGVGLQTEGVEVEVGLHPVNVLQMRNLLQAWPLVQKWRTPWRTLLQFLFCCHKLPQ